MDRFGFITDLDENQFNQFPREKSRQSTRELSEQIT